MEFILNIFGEGNPNVDSLVDFQSTSPMNKDKQLDVISAHHAIFHSSFHVL